jgi:hypothetical protein
MGEPRNIYEYLAHIRPRLAMYVGTESIVNLEHYLHGYGAALAVHGIIEEEVPSFSHFLSWLERTGEGAWSCGWARGLLGESKDEAEALDRFFTLAAEFGKLRVVEGETLELAPGHERSRAYKALNKGTRPVPSRLQLMYLQPGEWCYLRSWYGEEPQDDRWLHSSPGGVLWRVEWEYDVAPEAWGITLPPPDPETEHLQRMWEAHRRSAGWPGATVEADVRDGRP